MPKSRLMWPTREELRQRHALMDEMIEKRGVDVLEALRVDGDLAFIEIEARAKCRYCLDEGGCWRGTGTGAPRISVPTQHFSGRFLPRTNEAPRSVLVAQPEDHLLGVDEERARPVVCEFRLCVEAVA